MRRATRTLAYVADLHGSEPDAGWGSGVTPTFYPYRIARVFPIPGTEDERLLYKTVDLLLPPQRGQDVRLPGSWSPAASPESSSRLSPR